MWSAQLDCFRQGYRVIAPDLRGFGKSGGANDLLTMEQFADDLKALLDASRVEEPITLCGLSMGGYIAFQFALIASIDDINLVFHTTEDNEILDYKFINYKKSCLTTKNDI